MTLDQVVWTVVVLGAIVLLVALVARVVARRRKPPGFRIRTLPVGYFGAYEARIAELQGLFVAEPREAVAGARHLVEDLMVRLGYPTRLTEEERRADLASVHRHHGDLYRAGFNLRANASTEELRRALQAYLELARGLIARAQPEKAAAHPTEIAG